MKSNYFFTFLFTLFMYSGTSFAQTARVQAIHNSADAAAAVVDVYLSALGQDRLLIEDFAFRTASPFIDAPSGIPLTIKITLPDDPVSEAVYTSPTLTLAADETYILVADGIVSASGYEPAQPFGLQIYDMGREESSQSGITDVLVHHGSTDAPAVDVNLQSGSVLVDDIEYTNFAGYLELDTADYAINVTTADGETIVKGYDAPLESLNLGGLAITVIASGFLDPSVNSDGADFGLFVALPTGGALVPLPTNTLDVGEFVDVDRLSIYPNPNENGDLYITIPNVTSNLDTFVYDMSGREVLRTVLSKEMTKLDVRSLETGLYLISLTKGKDTFSKRLSIK